MPLKKITPQYEGKIICSVEEYHAAAAIGSSGIRTIINRSPAHYLWDKEHPEESTPAQQFGTAIHQAILEPKRFQALATVEPVFSGAGSRAEREKWHIQNSGKTILKQDQYDAIHGILNALRKNQTAYRLISEGHAEESLFWKDPETGVQCKARPDFVREGRIVVDVKSTLNSSKDSFRKDIGNGYHIQAALYLDACTEVLGGNYTEFIIIAVEKEPPYGITCNPIGPLSLQEGREQYQQGLKILKRCQETGIYPAYPDQLTPIEIASFHFKAES
jgi:exodeoxyribonuclease VIII